MASGVSSAFLLADLACNKIAYSPQSHTVGNFIFLLKLLNLKVLNLVLSQRLSQILQSNSKTNA